MTRDTEITAKLTVTRGEVGGDNGEKGNGHGGTCIKDTWRKSKGDRVEGGRWGMTGVGVLVGENGDNYLNNNKKM